MRRRGPTGPPDDLAAFYADQHASPTTSRGSLTFGTAGATVTPVPQESSTPTNDKPSDRWVWTVYTGRFSAEGHPNRPCRIVVEQIDDEKFRPHEDYGFEYRPEDESEPIVVNSVSLAETDFASIPRFMSWFVSRHGRHTAAALVHDQLVSSGMEPAARVRADDLFLEMMKHCDVPPVRRYVMWSAVAAATRWQSGWGPRLAMIAWGALAAAGMTALVVGLVTGSWWVCLIALVAPVPFAVLWGGEAKAGLVAGFALPPVAVPALVSFVGYLVYRVAEEIVRGLSAARPTVDVEQLPAPTSYKEM